MDLRNFTYAASAAAIATMSLASCEDEVSPIGPSIFDNEVAITIDSMTVSIPSRCVEVLDVDARSITSQIGRLDIPGFGRLESSYVTQLLAASALTVPDSIGIDRVDSTKLIVEIPRSLVTGDTLAPQQLTVYRLTKALPSGIRSGFDPKGYYNAAEPVNSKNYTLSGLNLQDSLFIHSQTLNVSVDLPLQWGRDAFTAYRENDEIFQWPGSFCEKFPGLYIKPSFGRGAMANISSTKVMIYYHYLTERTVVVDKETVKKQVTIKDSVSLFTSAPEVVSSSLYSYTCDPEIIAKIAKGKKIVTAPLGHIVEFTFPAKELLEQYWASDRNLSVINNLTLTFPASAVDNEFGLLPPPDLLMIRKKDVADFFANGKVPDNKTSFRGKYSSANGRYEFASMREFIVDLKDKQGNIDNEDLEFQLIPVSIDTETVTNSDGSTTVYAVKCYPYLFRPAIAEIFTDRANVVFTFTSQLVK